MTLNILHFNPLEQYPPIMNLLNTFDQKVKECNLDITVYSTNKPKNAVPDFLSSNIKIKRTSGIEKAENSIFRSLKYFAFNCKTLIYLLRYKPDTVLYYETISAFPAIFYKKYINKKCKLIAHYHEYSTVNEYQTGSGFVKRIWNFEKSNFGLLDLVSHTNEKRMELFKSDYPNFIFKKTTILPNYPPKSWSENGKRLLPEYPVRLVYVGALSTETMYLKEICEWVVKQGDKVVLDIYSSNISDSAANYLKIHSGKNINLKGGINYFDLPKILKDYHVGLILYKGVILNHVFSEPNKLFEYLTCGLNVWFPDVIEGCMPFVTKNEYPKVMALDFNDFDQYDLNKLIDKSGLPKTTNSYYCEPMYEDYFKQIKLNNFE